MKPRPVPTSPKNKERPVAALDELYRSEPSIVRPPPRTGSAILLTSLLSVVLSLGALLALQQLAARYPGRPLLELFAMRSASQERLIIRETTSRDQSKPDAILQKVEPALGVLVRSDAGLRAPSDRIGLAVFATGDGVALTVTSAFPDKKQVSISRADGTDRMVTSRATDPASGVTLVGIEDSSTSLAFADADRIARGTSVWVLRYDPFAGGTGVLQSSVVTTRDRKSGGPTTGGLVESSEAISRRIRLSTALDSTWDGAAAVDADGRLIGLVLSVPNEGATVVPASSLRNQFARFKRGDDVTRSVLGVSFVDLSFVPATAKLPSKGAYVSGNDQPKVPAVQKGSPAETAGIRNGDVIVSIDGTPLNELRSLAEILSTFEAGTKITVSVRRGDKTIELPVTLGTVSVKPKL